MKTKLQVNEYTRLEEEETLTENGTVFFVKQLNFLGSNYLGFGTVEIRKFHSASTKNTSLENHFRFVIFSLFQFVSFRNA